jgi:hypothetical protein
VTALVWYLKHLTYGSQINEDDFQPTARVKLVWLKKLLVAQVVEHLRNKALSSNLSITKKRLKKEKGV